MDRNLPEISEEATLLPLYSNSNPGEKQLAGGVSLPFFSFYKSIRTT